MEVAEKRAFFGQKWLMQNGIMEKTSRSKCNHGKN
jgi:hypothetical protein